MRTNTQRAMQLGFETQQRLDSVIDTNLELYERAKQMADRTDQIRQMLQRN